VDAGAEGLSARPALRFRAGGGRPPASHEVLLVDPGGEAWYLTGLPWPGQPPFDEIGAYHADLGAAAAGRLVDLARGVVEAPPGPDGPADAGSESVRLDGAEADWSPRARPEPAEGLVAAAREAIATVREHPWSVVHGVLIGPPDAPRVRLVNRGDHPLAVEGGELRAGWGRSARPPSPLRLAERPPTRLDLPARLAPGAPLEAELGPPGTADDERYDTVYGLVHLRWQVPVAGEGDWLDGWLVTGPTRGAAET